jgi:hypothetical protein
MSMSSNSAREDMELFFLRAIDPQVTLTKLRRVQSNQNDFKKLG